MKHGILCLLYSIDPEPCLYLYVMVVFFFATPDYESTEALLLVFMVDIILSRDQCKCNILTWVPDTYEYLASLPQEILVDRPKLQNTLITGRAERIYPTKEVNVGRSSVFPFGSL